MFKSTMIDETTKSVVDLRGSKQILGMTRHRARAVPLLFLLLNLTACSSWQNIGPVSPGRFIELDQPERVRVTMQDRTQMELERPVVDGDELVAPGVSMPLEDILSLEVRGISIIRSGLAGFGILVGGTYLIQLVECGVNGTWAC